MEKRKKYRYESIITKENYEIIETTLAYSFSLVIVIHMYINFIIPFIESKYAMILSYLRHYKYERYWSYFRIISFGMYPLPERKGWQNITLIKVYN